MVYDEANGYTVMFGGAAIADPGTLIVHNPTDTWFWNGSHWLQRYPAHNPGGRAYHVMVWDSVNNRIVLFGGRQAGTTDLNDTWVFQNNDWSQITTTDAPSPRQFAGAAFDRARGVLVLFGGNHTVNATTTTGTPTVTQYYDTWEFNGTNWTKVADNGPPVIKPLLVYDEARHQILMIAEDASLVPAMYTYDPSSHSWNSIKAATTTPQCVNDAAVTYQRSTATVLLVGGACVTSTFSSSTIEDAWQWDGSDWTKIATKTAIVRVTDEALAYDAARDVTVEFGGTEAFGLPRAATYLFDRSVVDADNNPPKFTADWIAHSTNDSPPGPRSLAPMRTDPINKIIYMLNGLTDGGSFSDFWMYQNGAWQKIVADNTPACGTPFSAFDTDRSKLVAVCNDGSTFEWDGTAWKTFGDLKTKPPYRQWAAMTYDQTLKKSVLYGGYDGANYVNTTWLWDGTTWTEQKNNRAPARGLTAIWFDPILKKTVIYGGIGRPTSADALERYNDMWSLGSNGWTEIKPSTLPPTRYGAQVAVDPRNGHAFLFGGLIYEKTTSSDGKTVTQKQFYANDEWQWDGSNWSPVQTNNTPPVRENGGMEFDYTRNEMVLFGGWAGYYLSDTWVLHGDTWMVIPERIGRTRAVGGH